MIFYQLNTWQNDDTTSKKLIILSFRHKKGGFEPKIQRNNNGNKITEMMTVRFRRTKYEKIERFTDRIWNKFFRSKGLRTDSKLIIYEICSGKVKIGYFEILLLGRVFYVRELIIDEKHRGKGFGKEILSKIESMAKRHDCHKIRLETSKELMPEAYALYKKFGFSEETTLKNDYFNKDWVILSKFIVNKKTKSEG
jgi:ribosomal protein S18 acetylase RimI-like enzyme